MNQLKVDQFKNSLIQDLEESKKIEVTQVDAYKTVKPEISKELKLKFLEKLNEMKIKQEIIKLTFTSSQCAKNFFELVDPLSIKYYQNNIEIYSIGPKVTSTIDELSKKYELKLVSIQSDEPSLKSLLNTLTLSSKYL